MKYIDRFKTMDDFLTSELQQLTGDRIATIEGFELPILKKKMKTVISIDPSTNEEVETEELQDVWSVPVGEVEKKVDHDYKMFFGNSLIKINYIVTFGQQTGQWSTDDELKELIRPYYKDEVSTLASYVFMTEHEPGNYGEIKLPILSTDNGLIRDVSTFSHDSESWRYVNLNNINTKFDQISALLGNTWPYIALYTNWNNLEVGQETTLQTIGGNSLVYSDGKRETFDISLKIKKMSEGTIDSDVSFGLKYVNLANGQEYVTEYDASSNTVSIYDEDASFYNLGIYVTLSKEVDGVITCESTDNKQGNTSTQYLIKTFEGVNSFNLFIDSNGNDFSFNENYLNNLVKDDYIITKSESNLYGSLRCDDSVIGLQKYSRTLSIPRLKLIKANGELPLTRSVFIAGDTPQGDFGATWYDSSVYGHPCCNLSNEDLGLSFYYTDLKVINEKSTDNGSTWVPDASVAFVDGNDVSINNLSATNEITGVIDSLIPSTSLYTPDGGFGGWVVFNNIQGIANTAITYNIGMSYNDMSYSDVFTIIWGDPSSQGGDSSAGDTSTGDSPTYAMTINPNPDDIGVDAQYTITDAVPTEFTVTLPAYDGMPTTWDNMLFDWGMIKTGVVYDGEKYYENNWDAVATSNITSDGLEISFSNLSSGTEYRYDIGLHQDNGDYSSLLIELFFTTASDSSADDPSADDPSAGDSSAGDSSAGDPSAGDSSVEPAVNHYYSLSFPSDPTTSRDVYLDVSNGNVGTYDVSLMLWEGYNEMKVINEDPTLCISPDYSTVTPSVTWKTYNYFHSSYTLNNDSVTLTLGDAEYPGNYNDNSCMYRWSFSCPDPDDPMTTLTTIANLDVYVNWWDMILDSNVAQDAYRDDTSVTSVKVAEGVTSIGESAFNGCSNLTKVSLPSTLTILGLGAFIGTAITSIVIPEGCCGVSNETSTHELGYGTFMNCTNLTSVTIPDSINMIGTMAFKGCSSLTSIELPYGCGYKSDSFPAGCTKTFRSAS